MASDYALANRLGFFTLGLTNNFAYVIMLAAAFDLLKESSKHSGEEPSGPINNSTGYCNPLSTSTILLADIVPSFLIKLCYPFLLLTIPTLYKVTVVALLSALSFLFTGFASSEAIIFLGVICASFSSGLGETTFLTSVPKYGQTSLSGWSMGTGAAGLLGAVLYAVLRTVLSIKLIMVIMLVIPASMMIAYLFVIKVVDETSSLTTAVILDFKDSEGENHGENSHINRPPGQGDEYGATHNEIGLVDRQEEFGLHQKLRYLPTLAKYFLPLFLVYFAEYFINQGLFELIYYPDVASLDHASQYSWFQVSYQLGVLISRSSLDLFRIKMIWLMSLLQVLNSILFLIHVVKIIHIPSFHVVILLIIYEGLLGGFSYTNTFYRLKTEIPRQKRDFSTGVVTIADTLGIAVAALVALPVHNALCKLY